MRIGMVVFTTLLTVTALQAWGAGADNPNVIDKPVVADNPAKFAEVAAQVRLDMQKGGRYEFMRNGDKQRVDALLGRIATQLDHFGERGRTDANKTISDLNPMGRQPVSRELQGN